MRGQPTPTCHGLQEQHWVKLGQRYHARALHQWRHHHDHHACKQRTRVKITSPMRPARHRADRRCGKKAGRQARCPLCMQFGSMMFHQPRKRSAHGVPGTMPVFSSGFPVICRRRTLKLVSRIPTMRCRHEGAHLDNVRGDIPVRQYNALWEPRRPRTVGNYERGVSCIFLRWGTQIPPTASTTSASSQLTQSHLHRRRRERRRG